MSKISLKHTSGKVVSLNSPTAEPGANDVAFKLPNQDGSANEYLKTDGSGNLAFATLPAAGGITEADLWRLNSALTLSNATHTTITSNWERPDSSNDGFNYLGTGMSVDGSGIWTFPSTGYWYVTYTVIWYANGNGSGANWIYLNVTEDNSNYSSQSEQVNSSATNEYMCAGISALVDVTNTSNVKVKFNAYASAANQVLSAASGQNRTYVTFIRLADT